MVNKYYQNNKEKLRKETREMSQDLLEEKTKKGKKRRDRQKSLSEEERKKVPVSSLLNQESF